MPPVELPTHAPAADPEISKPQRARPLSHLGVQLATVLLAATTIASIGSHLLADWLKLKTEAGQAYTIGASKDKSPAFLAGSSLASYGISWEEISHQIDREIKVWGIAGSSPFEWEQFQKKVPEVQATFIVVSAYDLDEAIICDFRADVVPIGHTIETLLANPTDAGYVKRSLSQYPLDWLRTLFPTLGRSKGVLGDLRIRVNKMLKPSRATAETAAGPTLAFGSAAVVDDYKLERISKWTESKTIGKLAAIRSAFQGSRSFDGVKQAALKRMLQYAHPRGRIVVIVLPVSPTYSREFMTPEIICQFEESLREVQHGVPEAQWLRLDQLPALASDDNFCDLVHINLFGQKIATEALQAWLKGTAPQP